jgi:phosphopantothenate synthetase
MLYDAFNKAWALTGLSKSEIEVLDNIARTLPDIMKKGEDARNEVLETLQGLIKQYS